MQFLDEDIYEAVKNHLPMVSEYVNSHGRDIKLQNAYIVSEEEYPIEYNHGMFNNIKHMIGL